MKWISVEEQEPQHLKYVLLASVNLNDNTFDRVIGARHIDSKGASYYTDDEWKFYPMYWAELLPAPEVSRAAIKRFRKERKI